LAGLHSETWQSFGSGANVQFLGAPTHWPKLQVAFTVHRSAALHTVPSGADSVLQLCVSSLHVAS